MSQLAVEVGRGSFEECSSFDSPFHQRQKSGKLGKRQFQYSGHIHESARFEPEPKAVRQNKLEEREREKDQERRANTDKMYRIRNREYVTIEWEAKNAINQS